MISILYTKTESGIKSGRDISRFFPVKPCIRLGCVLFPTLFNNCINWVMRDTVEKTDCGIALGDAKITDLTFDDDEVFFAKTPEVLVHAWNPGSLD